MFCPKCKHEEEYHGQSGCTECQCDLTTEQVSQQVFDDSMTWEDFLDSDDLDGYKRHWNEIDVEVVAETPCPTCGGKCGYIGFKRGSSYRAFSVCQNESCRDFCEF